MLVAALKRKTFHLCAKETLFSAEFYILFLLQDICLGPTSQKIMTEKKPAGFAFWGKCVKH